MVSVPNGMVPFIIRATRRNKPFISEEGAHERVHERALRPLPYGPPKNLGADVSVDVRHEGNWPVYTLTPTKSAPVGSVIYVHGGGWVNEIVSFHWQLAAQIAAEASTVVTVPIYPLVPFATAADVAAGVVALAHANREKYGSVALAGDSAGGQIALSVALDLRDEGVTLPATVLISPAVDLTITNPDIPAVQPNDPMLGTPGARVLADFWRGDRELIDPVVSPLFGDPTGLGPLTIYSGTHDILNPDTRLFVAKATEAGVEVDYTEMDGQLHVYPLLPTAIGASARKDIVSTIANALKP